jgi:hypothetical protein
MFECMDYTYVWYGFWRFDIMSTHNVEMKLWENKRIYTEDSRKELTQFQEEHLWKEREE